LLTSTLSALAGGGHIAVPSTGTRAPSPGGRVEVDHKAWRILKELGCIQTDTIKREGSHKYTLTLSTSADPWECEDEIKKNVRPDSITILKYQSPRVLLVDLINPSCREIAGQLQKELLTLKTAPAKPKRFLNTSYEGALECAEHLEWEGRTDTFWTSVTVASDVQSGYYEILATVKSKY
jgi:hypothetical protein